MDHCNNKASSIHGPARYRSSKYKPLKAPNDTDFYFRSEEYTIAPSDILLSCLVNDAASVMGCSREQGGARVESVAIKIGERLA